MQSFQVVLGNTFGNITGISEIDVANVELISVITAPILQMV